MANQTKPFPFSEVLEGDQSTTFRYVVNLDLHETDSNTIESKDVEMTEPSRKKIHKIGERSKVKPTSVTDDERIKSDSLVRRRLKKTLTDKSQLNSLNTPKEATSSSSLFQNMDLNSVSPILTQEDIDSAISSTLPPVTNVLPSQHSPLSNMIASLPPPLQVMHINHFNQFQVHQIVFFHST
jgi:hypothetical protein